MIIMSAADFARGVNSVLPCASTDATLPALCCVNLSWDAESFVFAATDALVCGEQTIAAADPNRAPGSVSIPVTTLKNALAVVKAVESPIVPIDPAGAVAGVAFVDPGAFPRYRALFPSPEDFGPPTETTLDPSSVAKLAGPKVKGRHSPLRLQFATQDGPITVTRTNDPTYRALLMPLPTATQEDSL